MPIITALQPEKEAKNARVREICKRAREKASQINLPPVETSSPEREMGPIEKSVQYFLSFPLLQFNQIYDQFRSWGNVVKLPNGIKVLNKSEEEAMMLIVRNRRFCLEQAERYDTIDLQNVRAKIAPRSALTASIKPFFIPRESLMKFYSAMDDLNFWQIYNNQISEANGTDPEIITALVKVGELRKPTGPNTPSKKAKTESAMHGTGG